MVRGAAFSIPARRFAYNRALARVKCNLDARTTDTTIPVLAWNLPAIRREWNQVKHQAAPWWRECSNEAYACGIADLVAALHNWSEAKHGRRGGRRIGFPRFKARRAANLRRESIHTLTTRLTRRYGTIVVEDLDVAAMARGMGRRAFRRSVYQAGIGRVRPTLAYKTSWAGGRLLVADRWFASSRTHHGCGGYRADLVLADRLWVRPRYDELVDRDANAACNLHERTGPVTDRDVERGGVAAPIPRSLGLEEPRAGAPGKE
jgi:IS605 OrfB family transposase